MAVYLLTVALVSAGSTAGAVEGGTATYLPGSRDSFAGIAPPPGTYLTTNLFYLDSEAPFIPESGAILDEVSSTAIILRFDVTRSFSGDLWGGRPYFTLSLPVVRGTLEFGGELRNGLRGAFNDEQAGFGDLTLTGAVGYNKGNWHWVYALGVYLPTGFYEPAAVDIASRDVEAISFSKNRYAIQPTVAYTYFNPSSGFELSGAFGITFSAENESTDYQSAPEAILEAAVLQHLESGVAFGLSGYAYRQIGEDSGPGADRVRALTGADSLEARVYGLGPIVSFGTTLAGRPMTMEFKYISEFGAKRRFESDVFSASLNITF